MSVLTQNFNPVKGKMEWEMQPEDYDYVQEVARSGYADMLHDTERNQKYYEALKIEIGKLQKSGEKVRVLDIGTGTGLLSMMAASCGADMVTACEAFKPMAECARTVLETNGFGSRVKLINKRSTELRVGPGLDMEERANLLVTEVFDTELIGEGAIGTFIHALKELLVEDCIVIPSRAVVYVQVVESEFTQSWNTMQPLQVGPTRTIVLPPEIYRCPGNPAVHDIQISQLKMDDFLAISDPLPVCRFDWTGRKKLSTDDSTSTQFMSNVSGRAESVFMWWTLDMDMEGKVTLSCAPYWSHPHSHHQQWRDHWMQAVYYLPVPRNVEKGEELTLVATHDEYSWWFDVHPCNSEQIRETVKQPVCSCGCHVAYSRSKLGMLNDKRRREVYVSALHRYITCDSVCLSLGDGSLLPLIMAHLGARHVYTLESHHMSRQVIDSFVRHNNLEDRVTVLDATEDVSLMVSNKIDLVVSEPYFFSTVLPWHSLYFWYWVRSHSHLLSPNVSILPGSATLQAAAVEFSDLWKIRSPLNTVEGFRMGNFDHLVESAAQISDPPVEPHPLWEYPSRALTDGFNLLTFQFTEPIPESVIEKSGRIPISGSGKVNGVALWMNYDWGGCNLSTGPLEDIKPNYNITWDVNSKQGVYFISPPINVDESNSSYLKYHIRFSPERGEFTFCFSVDK